MKSTCGAVICQPSGDELKHDIRNGLLVIAHSKTL